MLNLDASGRSQTNQDYSDFLSGSFGHALRAGAIIAATIGVVGCANDGAQGGKDPQSALKHPDNATQSNATQSNATQTNANQSKMTAILGARLHPYHEKVQDTVFIATVFDQQLSKEQYRLHLEQRLLMHQLMDDIFSSAMGQSPEIRAIYGDRQRETLTFLRSDLAKLGSTGIKEEQAQPETKAFLAYLRQVAASDPRAVIGAFNVFFGGITNGGLTIGARIHEHLSDTDAKYYTGCTGYSEFKVAMNTITDPALQTTIVDVAEETYKHIINMHNAAVYNAPGDVASQ